VFWRLRKAVYGLEQAAHAWPYTPAWHSKFTKELGGFGFVPCPRDPCFFIKTTGDQRLYLLVYVDDMLIGGELSDVPSAKQQIAKCFKTKDLGAAYQVLGFLIHRDELGIRTSQEQDTKVVLERFQCENAHTKCTPFNEGTAKECAVRCQCGSADKMKQHLRDVANECSCPPCDSEIDFPSLDAALQSTRTRRANTVILGTL
jgi:hypothetical protein